MQRLASCVSCCSLTARLRNRPSLRVSTKCRLRFCQGAPDIDIAVRLYLSHGVPARKIMLGLGTYGRTFHLKSADPRPGLALAQGQQIAIPGRNSIVAQGVHAKRVQASTGTCSMQPSIAARPPAGDSTSPAPAAVATPACLPAMNPAVQDPAPWAPARLSQARWRTLRSSSWASRQPLTTS